MIEEAVQAAREAGVPGVGLLWALGEGAPTGLFRGVDADGAPIGPETLFPVASVTKLATALAVLACGIAPEEELRRHLPEAVAASEGVTLRRLLSHSAGYPLDLAREAAPYRPRLDWAALGRACLACPLDRGPGQRVQYSNVGYGLLALVVERRSGQRFAEALQELVLGPLGIEGYLGVEPPRRPARMSDVRGSSAGTEREAFNSAFWRSLAMPWAGLITNADGALRLLRAFRRYPAATSNQNGELGGGMAGPLVWARCPWGLGPELRGQKSAPHWAPETASADSYGHAGTSGCVAWHDPRVDLSWFLVGTRVADGGWMVRHGPRIGAALLKTAASVP